jgi:tetratricopeptide (TPR) repeat protein
VSRCAAAAAEADPFLVEVMRLRDHENPEEARAALETLLPGAREAAAAAPSDADAQYRLALVLGAQLEHMDGTDKISGATEVHDQASRVLALSPQHAGASYMLGKLHATVRRMSGIKRFLATSLLGGSALKDASWEQAQALLEVAVREAPCVPEHHFELARVYQAREDLPAAQRELAAVLELTAGKEGRATTKLRERAEQFGREWAP